MYDREAPHKCFFALARTLESNVGLRIGALSSWKGFSSVFGRRDRVQNVSWAPLCPSQAKNSVTHLHVGLPDFLKEQPDPFVVFELVQDDNLDAFGAHSTISHRISWAFIARQAGSEYAPPGVNQADTVHSWNLSIDLRYLCIPTPVNPRSSSRPPLERRDSHAPIRPLHVLNHIQTGMRNQLRDMPRSWPVLAPVTDVASPSCPGGGGQSAEDGEGGGEGGGGDRCGGGGGGFGGGEVCFVERVVERADEDWWGEERGARVSARGSGSLGSGQFYPGSTTLLGVREGREGEGKGKRVLDESGACAVALPLAPRLSRAVVAS